MNSNHTASSADEEHAHIEPDWVDTPTSREIEEALSIAQTNPDIVLAYGGSGLGKTYTATRYANAQNRKHEGGNWSSGPAVYMITAHPAMSTVTATLSAISEAVGRSGDAYRNEAMVRQIRQSLKPGDLLLFDEAHNLETKALDQVRYFYDECGIGVAYLGNEEIETRISGGRVRQATFLNPLFSRVGYRLHVQKPTDEDVKAIMSAWGNIPARPFLGLSEEDRGQVLDILREHITKALQG